MHHRLNLKLNNKNISLVNIYYYKYHTLQQAKQIVWVKSHITFFMSWQLCGWQRGTCYTAKREEET